MDLRFSRKGKLTPRYIRPYEFVGRVERFAYHLSLALELQKVHNVFHVSMFQQYQFDLYHVIMVESIEVQSDLSYEEETVEILA